MEPLPGGKLCIPYFVIAERDFPLTGRVMMAFKPSHQGFGVKDVIFKNKWDKALLVGESEYGFLGMKIPILTRRIMHKYEIVIKIVRTCLILYNIMRDRYPSSHADLFDTKHKGVCLLLGKC